MHASHVCTIFRAILKALGATRRTCLVIVRVHVLRILPILAAVTDRRARKTATSYKQTCDVPVIGVTYNFISRQYATLNVLCPEEL